MSEELFDFARCVRPDGTAYGTGGTCRKGVERALSQKVGKNLLAKAPTEKLEDYLNRAPYKYQKDAIKAELDRRGAKKAAEKPAPAAGGKPSQKINDRFLREAAKEKLEEYLKKAPYQYQRDKIKAALEARAKKDGEKVEAAPKKKKAETPKSESETNRFNFLNDKDLDDLEKNYRMINNDAAKRQIKAIEKERARREDPNGVAAAERKYRDLMRKQQELANNGKMDEALEMGRDVAAARRNWEKKNAPAKKAQEEAWKKEINEAPKGLGVSRAADLRKLDQKIEKKTTDQLGDKDFDWKKSLTGDAESLAAGMYGTAIKDPDGVVVKRGELGQNEARILAKAHSLGLAPRMIAAELDGPGNYDSKNKMGRMAMDLAEGQPIGSRTGKVVENAYWKARADLHRGGIAHNDMHIQNVFVNDKGKGQFVDMGLAQDSPKAALAEAMGVFVTPPKGTRLSKVRGRGNDGDWQARRWDNIGGEDFASADSSGDVSAVNRLMNRYPTAYKVYANKQKAIKKMKSFGLSDQDVADVMTHGIRSKEDTFQTGGMGKLTDSQALQVINTLYDGV